jgi:transposase
MAIHHEPVSYTLLQTITGVGKIIALILLYEIENIRRFASVQDFVSYSRLVKCAKESNGKKCGSGGSKIGNAHLKWAFSEAIDERWSGFLGQETGFYKWEIALGS